jgi:MFS family permease
VAGAIESEVPISLPWYREVNAVQWKALLAAGLGWTLDGMDVMIYSMVIVQIMKDLSFNMAIGGLLVSVFLLASAAGGVLFGMIADKIGRTRALIASILIYSVFTAACGFAQTAFQLGIFRVLLGLGMGGEWVAGAALITETWEPKHRGKGMGIVQSCWPLGYALAAVVTALIVPAYGWRAAFFVGIIPALVTAWIRHDVKEPQIWKDHKEKSALEGDTVGSLALLGRIFTRQYLRRTLLACLLSACAMFAYWGLFAWVPGFLAASPEKGGVGLNVLTSSTFVVAMNIGGWLGYVSFGFIVDKVGRRKPWMIFMFISAILVPIYGQARDTTVLLLMGPVVAFFGMGYFSGFGTILAELYPTKIRATAQGFNYNMGRAVSACAPFVVGSLAVRYGLGSAFLITSAAFLLATLTIFLLPETKGKVLD